MAEREKNRPVQHLDGPVLLTAQTGKGGPAQHHEQEDPQAAIPLIVFDTETTGTCPDQICQLAYLKVWPDRIQGENFYFSVAEVDRHAYDVHRLSRERLRRLSEGRTFRDQADGIFEDFHSARRVAGHNVDFDIKHLAAEFNCAGRVWQPKNTVCTMKFFGRSVGATDRKGKNKAPNLAELCAFFGVKTKYVHEATQDLFGQSGNAHDARYDAAAVWLCLEAAQKKGQIKGLWGR